MKEIATTTTVIVLVSVPVPAAEQGGFTDPSSTTQVSSTAQVGGFTDPNGAMTIVVGAKSLRGDTWVVLRDKITERISDDLYKFQDASGVINVDIDRKRWNDVTVGPQDTVEIQGEVGRDQNSVEIDVKQTRKTTP